MQYSFSYPEKSSDLHYLKSWRTIFLLSTDLEILSKVIAGCLKSVSNYLFVSHQTEFMKSRHIEQIYKKMLDIIEYLEELKMPALIVPLDFEKCFDHVEHKSMYQGMRYFHAGEN